MKLAEALIERADIKKRLEQLNERMVRNAVVEVGKEPFEDPKRLLEDLAILTDRMRVLVSCINITNSTTVCDTGETLTELIARRDMLLRRVEAMRRMFDKSVERRECYGEKEKDYEPTMDLRSMRREMDAISEEARRIDTRIQGLNWNVDLIENIR